MELQSKIIIGLERIGEVFKTLLWQKAKLHGISPIQIQILLFIQNNNSKLSNISYLAKEFNVTKPTVSDAVRVLVVKKYLKKNYSTIDKRKFDLRLSASGQELVKELMDYRTSISDELEGINAEALETTFKTLSKLIYQLNKKGLIQVQRTCFACKFYDGDKEDSHHCKLLNIKLLNQDIKIDCSDFEVKLAS